VDDGRAWGGAPPRSARRGEGEPGRQGTKNAGACVEDRAESSPKSARFRRPKKSLMRRPIWSTSRPAARDRAAARGCAPWRSARALP